METPDITTYAVEPFEDELGEGVRIYDSADRLYEARDHGAWESRIYSDDGGWRVAVGIEEDQEQVTSRLKAAASRIEEEYGVDFVPSLDAIDGEVEEGRIKSRHAGEPFDGCIELSSGRGRVDTEEIEADLPRPDSLLPYWVGYGAGYAVGETALPGVGGFVAAVAMGLGSEVATKGGSFAAEHIINRRRRSKYRDIDILDDDEHFEQISELNRLEDREWGFETGLTEQEQERLDELREEDVKEDHSVRMHLHFRSFTDRDGYHFHTEEGTYDDAVAMVEAVLGREMNVGARPSIYSDAEAFGTVFERLDPVGREDLAANVIEREEVPENIMSFLNESYPEVVEEAGDTTVMEEI
ncbi:MAG: hypothetical protein SVU32_03235 [Candidatus Nanohaloarchaea archaeon]|nr:hypothetical protein [Candidatus Nanohaloarchaea archaeon]